MVVMAVGSAQTRYRSTLGAFRGGVGGVVTQKRVNSVKVWFTVGWAGAGRRVDQEWMQKRGVIRR